MSKFIFTTMVIAATASLAFASAAEKSKSEPVCTFTTTKGLIIHASMEKKIVGDNTFFKTSTDSLDITVSTKSDISSAILFFADKSGQVLASAQGGKTNYKGQAKDKLELSAVIEKDTYSVECETVEVAQ